MRGAAKRSGDADSSSSEGAFAALQETTCLVLTPPMVAQLTGGGDADDGIDELGGVLDRLLRDKFHMAAARMVHLSEQQARVWARAREGALQSRWGRKRKSDPIGTANNVDAVRRVLASGPCLVLALYRTNAVAHLYRVVSSQSDEDAAVRAVPPPAPWRRPVFVPCTARRMYLTRLAHAVHTCPHRRAHSPATSSRHRPPLPRHWTSRSSSLRSSLAPTTCWQRTQRRRLTPSAPPDQPRPRPPCSLRLPPPCR